jgi:hypothetical protein
MECSAVQIARILGNKRLTTAGKERIDRALGLPEDGQHPDISQLL